MKLFASLSLLGGLGMAAAPASAQTVNFQGAVVNTCVINITLPGALALDTTGTTLSSEELTGTNATVAVIATGTAPQLRFGAPQLTGPTASTANATKMISYNSPTGSVQAYTSGQSTYTMTKLIDTLTVRAKASNPDGFTSGSYTMQSTVTCQQ